MASSNNLGDIRARITLNVRDFETSTDTVRRRTRQIKFEVEDLQKAFFAMSGAMAAAVTAAVVTSGKFEQSMANLKAVSGATADEFDKLKTKAAELGATTSFSASQVADGMNFLAMAGFKTNDILESMAGVLNLAAAGQMDLARTSDIASNILTGFGISASEMTRVADVLAKTMTSSNTNIEQLGYAMKYVAPIATQAGVSFEETAAAVGKLSDAGIQADMAGTALRAIILRLINPPKMARDAMDELNLSVRDSNNELMSLPDIIRAVEESFEGLTKSQQTQYAAQIAGTEAASGFLTLISAGGDNIDSFAEQLRNAGGTAEEIAETQLDTLNGSIKELQSALEAVGITVGNQFAPMIRQAATELTQLALGFESLDNPMQNAIIAFVTMTPAIGSVVVGFYALRTAAIALQVSVPILGALSLAIGGLTALYAYQKTAVDEHTQAIEENRRRSYGLASEYDQLSRKVRTLEADSDAAKQAKDRMRDIMVELRKIAPDVVAGYDAQTNSIRSMTSALRENTREQMNNLKTKIAEKEARIAEINAETKSRENITNSPNGLVTLRPERIELVQEKTALEKELKAMQAAYNDAYTAAEVAERKRRVQDIEALLRTPIESRDDNYNPSSSTSDGGASRSGSSKVGSSSKQPKTVTKSLEDIAREQYQASMRWIQYKKTLNQMSVEDELAAYERLQERYVKYANIRMETDENIYRTKSIMAQDSFENSNEWITQEERRMRLNGATEQEVAQMKIDAWERVRSRYAENTEYYKRADTELYNLRMQIIREQEQAAKELERNREQAFKDLKRNILDMVRESEQSELDSIRKLKETELNALKERETAELESIERRKRQINDLYSEKIEEMEDEETAEKKKELLDDIEKYRYATSKDGREKYNRLLADLRELERREERIALDRKRQDQLRALDDEERDIKGSYDNRASEVTKYYDDVYESTKEHYNELLRQLNSYTGSAEGLERILASSRVVLNSNANNSILNQTSQFISDYNAQIAEMVAEHNAQIAKMKTPPLSNGGGGGYRDSFGGGGHEGDYDDFISDVEDAHQDDDGVIRTEYEGGGSGWYDPNTGNFGYDFTDWDPSSYHTGRDGISGLNYSTGNRLLPNEIAAILQDREYVFQPTQLDSLLSAVSGKGGGQTIYNQTYNAPLIGHDGDVRLEDDTDIKTYWKERELAAQRLLAGGERL